MIFIIYKQTTLRDSIILFGIKSTNLQAVKLKEMHMEAKDGYFFKIVSQDIPLA